MNETAPYLTQHDLEARWQISGRTLERWRTEDYGPAWYVLGGSIRYRRADVEEFELRQRRGADAPGGADA